MTSVAWKWLGAASVLAFSSIANAATVTKCGPTICYEYDDTQAAAAIYGQPTLLGDMLRFLPQNFRAQSDDGEGLVQTSASFVFDRVYTIGGEDIDKIMINEFGDYEITNGDRVSDDLTLDVVNTSGAGEFDSATENFTALGDSSGIQRWTIETSFDVAGSFETTSNDIRLTVTNLLEAETDAFGESAWIQKKVEIIALTAVPVPAAVWLMGSGLGVLGFQMPKWWGS